MCICPTPLVVAHDSWISREQFRDPESGAFCCDEHDCGSLTNDDVQYTGSGYLINGQYFVADQRVLLSGDSRYWACFNSEGKGPHDRPKDIRCFFAPLNM